LSLLAAWAIWAWSAFYDVPALEPAGIERKRFLNALLPEDVDSARGDKQNGDRRDAGLAEHRELDPAGERHGVGGLKAIELVNET
jgi:hypothetical protein